MLSQLSNKDLNLISEALNSGNLEPPYSEFSLSKFCHKTFLKDLKKWFDEKEGLGFSAGQISNMINEIYVDRKNRKLDVNEYIDLVWSGPEVQGITNRDTKVVVDELFSSAKESVILSGFAFYNCKEVLAELAKRMKEVPALSVKLFLNISRKYGDFRSDKEIVNEFYKNFIENEWPGESLPEIYYDPRALVIDKSTRASLHAKCIVIDKKLSFVSSANFTEAAQERNIEAGVLINSKLFAEKLVMHFELLAEVGVLKKYLLEKIKNERKC